MQRNKPQEPQQPIATATAPNHYINGRIKQVHISVRTKQEMRDIAQELLISNHPMKINGRSVLAVGEGPCRHCRAAHDSMQCERLMQLGRDVAKAVLPAGIEPGFTHGLVAITPQHKRGGIGTHKDRECVARSPLLGIGLEGNRDVRFVADDGRVITTATTDYIAVDGMSKARM